MVNNLPSSTASCIWAFTRRQTPPTFEEDRHLPHQLRKSRQFSTDRPTDQPEARSCSGDSKLCQVDIETQLSQVIKKVFHFCTPFGVQEVLT